MKIIGPGSTILVLAFLSISPANGDSPREALQPLQEYIGAWKGSGTSEKNKSEIWKETAAWSWQFKGKDVFFAGTMPESKNFKTAEIHFLADKDRYQFVLVDRTDKKLLFEGTLKKNRLLLERLDPATRETQQLQINTAGDGDRLILTYSTRPENRTLFNKIFQVAYTREGVTFAAAGQKKNECVVTGGLGTMPVTHKGVTYYVCCTGCRDAFYENPDKIIKEYLARKKSGQ